MRYLSCLALRGGARLGEAWLGEAGVRHNEGATPNRGPRPFVFLVSVVVAGSVAVPPGTSGRMRRIFPPLFPSGLPGSFSTRFPDVFPDGLPASAERPRTRTPRHPHPTFPLDPWRRVLAEDGHNPTPRTGGADGTFPTPGHRGHGQYLRCHTARFNVTPSTLSSSNMHRQRRPQSQRHLSPGMPRSGGLHA